jgi:hypothetical protein
MHFLARLPDPVNAPHRHGGPQDVTQEEGEQNDR